VTADLSALEQTLFGARRRFLDFVRRRIADPDLAEDVLQDALLRAVQHPPDAEDPERITAWFYRVLRHAVTDAYRRRAVLDRRLEHLPEAFDAPAPAPEEDRALCECFRGLIPGLSPAYAEVIERVELGVEEPAEAARRLGITPNNLKVRRHRARQALRERLEQTCRTCSDHGCLDCTCGGASV
jgi:RNA polymerase sigma factor (sigma-70 family)